MTPPRCCVARPARRLSPPPVIGHAPDLAALVTAARWPNGKTLRVAFRGGTFADRAEVMGAAAEWSLYAHIDFVQVTRGPSDVRVTFDQSEGSWSYVGTEVLDVPPDQATLNIGWPDDYGRSLHELGHTLGLIHEHQNPAAQIPWNVPAVLAYYEGPPNRWSAEEVRSQVLEVYAGPLTNGGYDRHSIMLYPIPAELLLDPSFAVGWNRALSDEDRAFISAVYPGRFTPPTPAQPVSVTVPFVPSAPPTPAPPNPLPPAVTVTLTPPAPEKSDPDPGATMSKTTVIYATGHWIIALLQKAADYESHKVDNARLLQTVAVAEFEHPGVDTGIKAVIADAAGIFPDPQFRSQAVLVLGLVERFAVGLPGA